MASTKVDQLKTELLVEISHKMERDSISQGEVARRIGALRHNVNQVLRGRSNASLDFLVKIAESIGLDVGWKMKKVRE